MDFTQAMSIVQEQDAVLLIKLSIAHIPHKM